MLDSLKSAVASGLEDALFVAIETGNRAEALQIMYSVRDALDAQQITKDQAMRIYKDYDAYLDSLA